MTAPRSFMRALAAFDPNGWSLARGIRGALGCCVPLLASEWYGNPALSWAALIGFWVALVDPGWLPRNRSDRCRDRPLIGGIMSRAMRSVGYVAGWGLADGMDAAFGWDGD
jgi:hypothetical protein